MNQIKVYKKNGLDIIIKNNPKTPRMSVVCHFLIEEPEKYAGTCALFAKLLLQGTKSRPSNVLLDLIENNGIEIDVKYKQDYLCTSALFLNEDCELATDILADILQNSTFDEFEKEVYKLKGEIQSELDIPRVKATDAFVRGIFSDHYYSNSHTRIEEDIDKITRADVEAILKQIATAKKSITIVGDITDADALSAKIEKKFHFLNERLEREDSVPQITPLSENKVLKVVKNDVQQAQILQGWHAVNFNHEDYPKIIVMNNILGSSGLSSRLFVELRDKKGLAYTVRSSFETLRHGAIIYFYIATDPKNIKTCFEDFEIEIKKMQTDFVSEQELQGGKENVLGRLEYFTQTNAQQALTYGYDWIMGLGLDYEEKYRKMIENVSFQDIKDVANKYFAKPSLAAVLAPEKNLSVLS